MSYELIKKYFVSGLFSETDLDLFVQAGWITADVLTTTLGKMTKTGVVDYVVDMTGASKESVYK